MEIQNMIIIAILHNSMCECERQSQNRWHSCTLTRCQCLLECSFQWQ